MNNPYMKSTNYDRQIMKSLELYLGDTIDRQLSQEQRNQSRDAALQLIEIITNYLNDSLPVEIAESILKIFSRVSYDLMRKNENDIKKDISAVKTIKNML